MARTRISQICVDGGKAALVALMLAAAPMAATAQIPASAINTATLAAGCATADACASTISGLISSLGIQYPTATRAEILGAIGDAVAAAYNAGQMSAAAAAYVFSGLGADALANGLGNLSNAFANAAIAASTGNPVNASDISAAAASDS